MQWTCQDYCFCKVGISSKAPVITENDLDIPFEVLKNSLELLCHEDPDLVPNNIHAETFININEEESVSQTNRRGQAIKGFLRLLKGGTPIKQSSPRFSPFLESLKKHKI